MSIVMSGLDHDLPAWFVLNGDRGSNPAVPEDN
jgi:hypothetical protein